MILNKLFFISLFSLILSISISSQSNWEAMKGVPGDADMSGMAIAPDGKWYVVGDQVIYSSSDQGESWVCETEHGHLPKIRRLKFLEDGTPIWGDQNLMVIKRDGEWHRVGFSNDFETFKDTLYGISGNRIQKSWDKGLTWENHIFIPGTTIYRYRRHNDRHYIEYENSPNRKFGEVNLEGEILRWRYGNSTGFKAFLIDDCNNIHYFFNQTHLILYANGSSESNNLALSEKISASGGQIFRLQNEMLWKVIDCGADWEEVYPASQAIDFFPLAQDSFMMAYSNYVEEISLTSGPIESYPIKNTDYSSWGNQEMPDGTIYLKTNQGSFRILPDGTVESFNGVIDFIKYGSNGWLFRSINNNGVSTDTLFISKDRGSTWEKHLFPEAANVFYEVFHITNDLVALSNIFDGGTVLWYYDQDISYVISPDPDNNLHHSYLEYKLIGEEVIMKNNAQDIFIFNINTQELRASGLEPNWGLGYNGLDNNGDLFAINPDNSILRAIPYPYQQIQEITLPEDGFSGEYGDFRDFTTTNDGCLVLYRYGLLYFDRNLVMSQVDLGPAKGVQMNEIIQAKSGRWILRTFGKQQTYISSSAFPTDHVGSLISGQVIATNQNCEDINPISALNWKVNLSNQDHNYYLFGQESGKFNGYIQAGDYDVDIVPPSYSTWDECDWLNSISVSENQSFDSLDVRTFFVDACDAAILSISAPFFRRCFESYVVVEVKNPGQSTLLAPNLRLNPESGLQIISSNFDYEENGGQIEFQLEDIGPGEMKRITCSFLTDCNTPLNDQKCVSAEISVDNACSELSYSDELCLDVIGSWDPNEKYATNQLGTNQKFFEEDEYIYFKVRFQNVGTDTAFNVRLVDQLDPFIDLMTFEVISASHNHSFTIDDTREMVVLFENIMLADSNINEPASHGHFEYRIKAISDFSHQDSIRNSAGIYFDFNEAVITNQVIAKLEPKSSSQDIEIATKLNLWPNPTSDYIFITLDGKRSIEQLSMFDINGKIIKELKAYKTGDKIDISNLDKGLYYLKLQDKEFEHIISLVKI